MRRNDIATARNPELIVCSIDYDGCISGYSAGDYAKNMYIHLSDLLIRHPQANLVLMVGSARQSIFSDLYHELAHQNGSCWVFLKSYLECFQSDFPDLAGRISLDPFLLEDIFCEKNPGYHFDIRVNSFSKVLVDAYMERAAVFRNGVDIQWQDLTKKSLIYAQLHYIGMKHPGKKIAFHFYDDRMCVLQPLYNLYRSRVELIPNNFSLRLFNYVAGYFNAAFTADINGVGYVDRDYSESVKKLHSADWLSLYHANMANRVLDEPNLALAVHLYHLSQDKNNFILRLREKWGCAAFGFLDHLCIQDSEKMKIAHAWLPDAVNSRDIEFTKLCVRYVHANVCVEYFIKALEGNDNELTAVFSPILDSPFLGDLSRNDINILLFLKKKYDLLKKHYVYHYSLSRLIEWSCSTDSVGLNKPGLKNLLDEHFVDHQTLPLLVDLKRFCYHLSSLPGDVLTGADFIALRAIVMAYANDNSCFEVRHLSAIILSQITIDLVGTPEDSEKIKQKYLHANTADYPSEVQKMMIEKIHVECLNHQNDALLTAYRALSFAILSVSLPSKDVLKTLCEVMRDWKNAESIIPGKTHLVLLIEQDRALRAAASSRPRSASSFFCCCCDTKVVFSHEEFVNTLPIVAVRNAASKMERRVPSKYALSY